MNETTSQGAGAVRRVCDTCAHWQPLNGFRDTTTRGTCSQYSGEKTHFLTTCRRWATAHTPAPAAPANAHALAEERSDDTLGGVVGR